MGNLEKLVVLTVIFLSGIVLTVSLNTESESQASGRTPVDLIAERAEAELGAGQPAPPAAGDRATVAADGPEGGSAASSAGEAGAPALLSAAVERQERGAASQGAGPSAGDVGSGDDDGLPKGVLRRVPEVTETAFADLALYTCRGTETYASLARRLYGSVEFVGAIKVLNEGHDSLASGDELLVPLDARPRPTRERSLDPRPSRPAPRTRNIAAPEPISIEIEEDELGATEVVHIVAAGETLSDIAARYYGKGILWRRIYDHNRDVIDDPDRVREGTELAIP